MKPRDSIRLHRRALLRGLLAAAAAPLSPGLALAGATERRAERLVLIQLRGGVDGLMWLPPWGDPAFSALRQELEPARPGGVRGALDLDGTFGLHPDLRGLHDLWREGALLPIHAVASPYRRRSHFDAQNVMETGRSQVDRASDGWLGRALALLQSGPPVPGEELGLAVGRAVPRVLRGRVPVASWAPDALPAPGVDTLERLRRLYAEDAFLGPRLVAGLEASAMVDGASPDIAGHRQEPVLAHAAGTLLAADPGPRIAVLDFDGWDTHADQNGNSWRLRVFDAAIGALREALGEHWRHTVVLVVTEFGRTVAINGTGGTDHGTGGMALLLGGAVRGGRVLTDWPSLASTALLDGRDLLPTLDLRSVVKSVLHEHMRLSRRQLERVVFPQSRSAPRLRDLLRG